MSRDIAAKTGSVSSNHDVDLQRHGSSSSEVLQSTPVKTPVTSPSSKESPVTAAAVMRSSPTEKSSSPEGDVSKRLSEMSNSFYSVYKRSSATGGMDRSVP